MIHSNKPSGDPEKRMPRLRLSAGMESFGSFNSFIFREMEHEGGLEDLFSSVDLAMEEVLVNGINFAYPQG